MKNLIVTLGVAVLALASTALARGRGRQQNSSQIVVTQLAVSPAGQDANISLAMNLDVRVASTVGSDVTLTAVTACKVGGETQTDTTDLRGDLSDLDVGDTKHFEASPFTSSNLAAAPSECQVTIRQNQEFRHERE